MLKRAVLMLAACLFVSACTTTQTKLAFDKSAVPSPGARVLLLKPDVELALLTASGVQEPRADWNRAARENISAKVEAALASRSHTLATLDPQDALSGRAGQLLRLHDAVGQSILVFSYGPLRLPTKQSGFDWTLGEGALELGTIQHADYALFIRGEGSYASGARVATAIGMSLVGVSVPVGGQRVFASLVDLKSGRIVWFNIATTGPTSDMRDPDGAEALVASLIKDIPL